MCHTPGTSAAEQLAAQPQRAATPDGKKGNVDAEARTKQERWNPLSACSRGLYALAYVSVRQLVKEASPSLE